MINIFLKAIKCKNCGHFFYMCQSCWRGHLYCCVKCRRDKQKQQHNKSQRLYRQTQKGKKAHREGEKRRRNRKSEKNMDERSSTLVIHDDMDTEKEFCSSPYCHFCGKSGAVVLEFPHREYGGRYSDPVFAGAG